MFSIQNNDSKEDVDVAAATGRTFQKMKLALVIIGNGRLHKAHICIKYNKKFSTFKVQSSMIFSNKK
jgi:hypothetical protein